MNNFLGLFEKKVNYFKLIVSILVSYYFLANVIGNRVIEKWNLLDSVDLIFHEAGHTLFIFFGDFIHVLGGSLMQVLVPLVLILYFLFKQEFFSSSILMFWLGQSIINVSIYAADSIRQELPLLGGDGVMHDWNYILTSLNLLKYTYAISNAIYAIGAVMIVLAVVFSLFLSCYNYLHESN